MLTQNYLCHCERLGNVAKQSPNPDDCYPAGSPLRGLRSASLHSRRTNIYLILHNYLYRGLYHFSVAQEKGEADDPVKYFAAKENLDLGVVKSVRKPVSKLHLSPFPTPS